MYIVIMCILLSQVTSDVGRPMDGAVSVLTASVLMCGHFEITLHQCFEVMSDAQYTLGCTN